VTLSELLARFDDVEETPDGYLVHCPAHNDSQQSLRFSVSAAGKVLVKDRAGCETKDVLKALGLTMRDLAKMTPGDVDLSKRAVSQDVAASPAEVAKLAVQLDRYAAALIQHVDATDYARDRFGVTLDDAERLGLGFADDLGGGPRLVVPFRDRDGVPRGFQARALEKDAVVRWLGPKSPDGASWAKVGYFPGAGGYDEVLVTEGPGDALTGAAAGFDTIGIRGAGLAANPAVIDSLVSMIGDREAIIAGDGDPAGRRFTSSLAEALALRDIRVRILRLHDGRDLTDWRGDDPSKFHMDLVRHIAKAEPTDSM
jgi:putative DNA primase/helicase